MIDADIADFYNLNYNLDDLYYYFGDYIYNYIKPEVTGNLDMFKYILGKIYLDLLLG